MRFCIARSRKEIERCEEVILAFRINLEKEAYVDLVLEMIRKDHFELVYISNEEDTKAIAFIGYRSYKGLRTGKMIYVDDLYTSPEVRGKGYATALLGYVDNYARENGIRSIHLDSGFSLYPAHRLYLNSDYFLSCHHFTKLMT